MKKLSILFAALIVGVSSLFAEDVSITTFTETSGTIGAGITYYSDKGGGTTTPAVNSGCIRLYQGSSSNAGGRLVIKAPEGIIITKVDVTSSMATTVGYIEGKEITNADAKPKSFTENGKSATIKADETFTASDLNCSVITFACLGTSSSSRLYVSAIKVTYTVLQKYTITVTANPTEAGTVSASLEEACEGTVITLTETTDDSYVFTQWYAVDADANEITITDGKFTMPASNVEVEGIFREKDIYEVTWLVNGEAAKGTPTTAVIEGEEVEALPDVPTSCEKSKVFMGWTDAPVTDGNIPELLFTEVKNVPAITENSTFYAVFATCTETGVTYTTYSKLQPTDNKYSISNGEYLIVATTSAGSSYAYAGRNSTTDKYGKGETIQVKNNAVSTKPESAVEVMVTITDESNKYFSLYDGTYWLSAPKDNFLTFNEKEADGKDAWVLNEKYGSIQSVTYSTRYLQYNSNSPRFACYTGSQVYAYLYKKIEYAEVVYSDYTTSLNCSPTEIENIPTEKAQTATKVIENGVLYILRDGIRYNAQGVVVE